MVGREKNDEAIGILREMTSNPDRIVRSEAGRYLRESGAPR